MSIHTRCPHCGLVGNVPEQAVGKSVRCPQCKAAFTVEQIPATASNTGTGHPPASDTKAVPPVVPAHPPAQKPSATPKAAGSPTKPPTTPPAPTPKPAQPEPVRTTPPAKRPPAHPTQPPVPVQPAVTQHPQQAVAPAPSKEPPTQKHAPTQTPPAVPAPAIHAQAATPQHPTKVAKDNAHASPASDAPPAVQTPPPAVVAVQEQRAAASSPKPAVEQQVTTASETPTQETALAETQPTAPVQHPAAPKPVLGKLGRFELREVLGEGGFGTVYRALDPVLGREVALKVPKFGAADRGEAQRLLHEAKAAANLRHPNIVAVYEVNTDADACYVASEFVPGKTLSALIKEREQVNEKPDFRQIAAWVRDLAEALHYAHSEEVVHRDVKPHNVMIDTDGRPQLTDFGLAKRTADDATETRQGTRVGTLAYMSPEQARGDTKATGPKSDQYSLGATLYELLTGKKPFRGAEHQVVVAVQNDPPAPLQSLRPDVPDPLAAICLEAMAKDPADRYADCHAMAADLDRWLDGELVLALRHSIFERTAHWVKRHPAVAGWTAAAVCLVLFLSGITITFNARSWAEARSQTRLAETRTQEAEMAIQTSGQDVAEAQGRAATAQDRFEMLAYARSLDKTVKAAELDSDLNAADEALEGTRWDYRHFEYAYLRRQITGGDKTLYGHEGPVNYVAYSPDGSLVASGGNDATVRVWNTLTGECVLVFRGHTKSVTTLAFSPDGKHIASGTARSRLYWYGGPMPASPAPAPAPAAPKASAAPPAPPAPRAPVKAATTEPSHAPTAANAPIFRLASYQRPTVNECELKIWEVQSGKEIAGRAVVASSIGCLCYRPDGKCIAVAAGGTVQFFSPTTGEPLAERIEGGPDSLPFLAFGNDGKRLLCAAACSTSAGAPAAIPMPAAPPSPMAPVPSRVQPLWSIVLWAMPHGKPIPIVPSNPSAVALSLDGSRLATADEASKTVAIWAVPLGVEDPGIPIDPASFEIAKTDDTPRVRYMAFSPDDRLLAITQSEWGTPKDPKNAITVCCGWTGRKQYQLKGHTQPVSHLQFRPDSKQLATASYDGTVKLWDVSTDPRARTLCRSRLGVTCLAFSPDSRYLVTTALADHRAPAVVAPVPARAPVAAPRAPKEVAPLPKAPKADPSAAAKPPKAAVLPPQQSAIAATSRGSSVPVRLASYVGPGAPVACAPPPGLGQTPEITSPVMLWEARSGRFLRILSGHFGNVYGAAFSPDGQRIATAGHDKTVIVWDRQTGNSVMTLTGHSQPVMAVAYSPDGRLIGSAGCELLETLKPVPAGSSLPPSPAIRGEIRLWDASSGKPIRTMHGHSDETLSLAFGPDGKRLVTSSLDRTVRVWDVATGQETALLEEPDGVALEVAFQPVTGRQIAAAVNDPCHCQKPGEIVVWDAESGDRLRTLRGHPGPVCGVVYSSDGKRLVSIGNPPELPLPTWKEGVHRPKCAPAWCVPCGSRPLELQVRIWDADTGAELLIEPLACPSEPTPQLIRIKAPIRYSGSTGNVTKEMEYTIPACSPKACAPPLPCATCAAMSRDATMVAVAGMGGVQVFDAQICQPVSTKLAACEVCSPKPAGARAMSVAFSPNGKLIAVAGDGGDGCNPCWPGEIRLYDAITGRESLVITGHTGHVFGIAFSPDSQWIAVAAGSLDTQGKPLPGEVQLWNTRTGAPGLRFTGDAGFATCGAFHPDGNLIAAGGSDRTVRLWDVKTGQEVRELKGHTADLLCLAFSPNGKLLATGSGDPRNRETPGQVKVWSTETWTEPIELPGFSDPVGALAFTPDSNRLAVGSGRWDPKLARYIRGTITLFAGLADAAKPPTVTRFDAHHHQILGLSFPHEGPYLASAGADWVLNLWEPASGRQALHLPGHRGPVVGCAFSSDGSRLATVSTDRTFKVWDVASAIKHRPDCGCCPEPAAVALHAGTAGTSFDVFYTVWKPVYETRTHEEPYQLRKQTPDGKEVLETCVKSIPYTVCRHLPERRVARVETAELKVFDAAGKSIDPVELRRLLDEKRPVVAFYIDDYIHPLCFAYYEAATIIVVVPLPRPPMPTAMACVPPTCAPAPAPAIAAPATVAPPAVKAPKTAAPAPPAPPAARPAAPRPVVPKEAAPAEPAGSPPETLQLQAIEALRKLGVRLETDAAGNVIRLTASADLGKSDLTTVWRLIELRELEITWNIRVTPESLLGIKWISKLRTLILAGDPVTDDGLEPIAALACLEKLDLYSTSITDKGLEHLRGLTLLKELRLAWNPITDAGLGRLTGLKSLQSLDLAKTKITDGGLKRLAELPSLTRLVVKNTAVTDQGVAALKAALPQCEVER